MKNVCIRHRLLRGVSCLLLCCILLPLCPVGYAQQADSEVGDAYTNYYTRSGFECEVHIPKIIGSSSVIREWNAIIYEELNPVVTQIMTDRKEALSMEYTWERFGNILSIHVWAVIHSLKGIRNDWFYAVDLSGKNDGEVEPSSLIHLFYSSEEDFYDDLRDALTIVWAYNGWLDPSVTNESAQTIASRYAPSEMQAQLRKTISEDNAFIVYLEDRELWAAAMVYGPGSYCNPCRVCVSNPELSDVWEEPIHTTGSSSQEIPQATEPTVEPVYLCQIDFTSKFGKVWFRMDAPRPSHSDSPSDAPECWANMDRLGYTKGPVRDCHGNTYDYGMHLDGPEAWEYYITFDLGGQYTTFSGYYGYPANVINSIYTPWAKKFFRVYGDGQLIFSSSVVSNGSPTREFEIDVTGVSKLKICYPPSENPNEACTIFDAMLS